MYLYQMVNFEDKVGMHFIARKDKSVKAISDDAKETLIDQVIG